MNGNAAFTFVLGIVIGAGVTYLCMKSKVDDEIEEVREAIVEKREEEAEIKLQQKIEKEDIFKAANELLSKNSYTYNDSKKDTIYTVSSDEAGEDGYKLLNFVYHTDGIITDNDNNPVDNVPLHLGINYMQMIKDTVGDFVYIRNEPQQTDYEIEISDKAYSYIDEEPHRIGKRHIDYDDYYEDEEE